MISAYGEFFAQLESRNPPASSGAGRDTKHSLMKSLCFPSVPPGEGAPNADVLLRLREEQASTARV